jgi:hypothetical protein
MVVIKLRTKIEVFIALLMMIVLATITAVSVTRTITDTGDSVETFIKNSNGNYWSVSESNIQAAIDDLGVGGWKNGIVWVPGNEEIIVNTGIVLKKYVTLDLQGSYLDVRSNVYGVTMAEGSTLRGGTIDTRNYAGTYTKAAVAFDPAVVGHDYWTGNVVVQNMYLQGAEDEGAGIQYQCGVQGDTISFTQCSNIQIYHFKYGILLNVIGGADTGAVTYANSNTFSDIRLIHPTYAIYLHRNTALNHNQCACDGNMFNNIITETGPNTQRIIFAEGRYNIFDNIFTWDWSGAAGIYAYEFPADSSNQYLKFFGGSGALQSDSYYKSNGTNNFYINMGYNQQSIVRYNQASEPDIPNNTMAFWADTDAGPKYYIIQDFGGTQKKAELT